MKYLMLFAALAFPVNLPAQTVPSRVPEPPIRTYGDDRIVTVSDELPAFLAANAGLVGSVGAKQTTYARALALAHSLAKQAGSDAALAKLGRLVPGLNPGLMRAFAVGNLAKGNQGGVLVLLVAALDREPDNADNLFNLASILATFGYPNEALAILDELARRGLVPSPPMGLSGADTTEYLGGYCLALTGRLTAARPMLERVRDRQPLLAEAPRTLALIDEKEGKDPRRNFLLGVWRHRSSIAVCGTGGDKVETGDPFQVGKEVAVDAESLLDWSKARRGVLPSVPYAATMEAATSMHPGYEILTSAAGDKLLAIDQARALIRPRKYNQTELGPQETWGGTMQRLIQLDFKHFPKIAAADREVRAASRASSEGREKIRRATDLKVNDAIEALLNKGVSMGPREEGVVAKPFRDAALAEAKPLVNREETAIRKRFDLWHQMATAVGGQIGDAAWRGWVKGRVEYERQYSTIRLLDLVYLHAALGKQTGYDAPPVPLPGNSEESDLAACDGSKSFGVGLGQIGPVRGLTPITLSAELSCEGFSMEIGVEVMPMVSISSEFGVSTKGEISVFVGPKGEAGIAGVGGGSVKAGFYVTGGRDGLHDVGVRAEAKTLATLGGTGIATKVGEGKFSFVPGPEMRPPVAGLSPLGVK